MLRWRGRLFCDPVVNVLVRGVEQPFESVKSVFVQFRQLPIGESPENQVNLPEPTTPRAESKLLAAVVHRILIGRRCEGGRAITHKDGAVRPA